MFFNHFGGQNIIILFLFIYSFVFLTNVNKKHFGHNLIRCNICCFVNTNFKNNKSKIQTNSKRFELWGFYRMNYLLFIYGVILILLGYVVMVTGEVNSFQSLTIAPIFLFIGYIILIPLALIIEKKEE